MPAAIRSPSPRRRLRPSGVIPWTDRRCGRIAPACSQASDSDDARLTEPGSAPRRGRRAPTQVPTAALARRHRRECSDRDGKRRRPGSRLHAVLHGLPRRSSRRRSREGASAGSCPRPIHAYSRGPKLPSARTRRGELRAVGCAIGRGSELARANLRRRRAFEHRAAVHLRGSHRLAALAARFRTSGAARGDSRACHHGTRTVHELLIPLRAAPVPQCYSGTCNSSRCLALSTSPYTSPTASHVVPTLTASALIPENTASTTTIPQIGTSQCLTHAAEPRLTPKYASTETCRNRNPLKAPKFTMEARSSSRFFMYKATASDKAAVTNMPM